MRPRATLFTARRKDLAPRAIAEYSARTPLNHPLVLLCRGRRAVGRRVGHGRTRCAGNDAPVEVSQPVPVYESTLQKHLPLGEHTPRVSEKQLFCGHAATARRPRSKRQISECAQPCAHLADRRRPKWVSPQMPLRLAESAQQPAGWESGRRAGGGVRLTLTEASPMRPQSASALQLGTFVLMVFSTSGPTPKENPHVFFVFNISFSKK